MLTNAGDRDKAEHYLQTIRFSIADLYPCTRSSFHYNIHNFDATLVVLPPAAMGNYRTFFFLLYQILYTVEPSTTKAPVKRSISYVSDILGALQCATFTTK